MAERHRLRGLQMREARMIVPACFRLKKQRALQGEQCMVDALARRPHPEPEIRRTWSLRDVPLQPPRGIARNLADPRFELR